MSSVYEGKYIIKNEDIDKRLDIFLSENTLISRSRIKKYILRDAVRVNKKIVKPSYRLKSDDIVEYEINTTSEITLTPCEVDISIFYHDESIIVVNKQAGLVVHPGAGEEERSLIAGLLNIMNIETSIGAPKRPGIVHRLDKDTSGVMVIARTDNAYYNLIEQFINREVDKEYRALVRGVVPEDEGVIDMPISRHPTHRKKMHANPLGNKKSVTYFKVIERFDNCTYLACFPKTGRTHQIRVHLKFLSYPVIGDEIYGERSELIERQALHSYKIEFSHPVSNERLTFIAEIPDDLSRTINVLKDSG